MLVVQEVIANILPQLGVILSAPLKKPSLIWQLAPILCIWILVELYFGTHKKEKLGWNTALSNGISLFWIVISAMQHIFSASGVFSWDKFIIILLFAFYALFVTYISFSHKFKASVTYVFASPTPLFYFSAIVLLFAHDLIVFSWSMILAIALLFVILLLVFFIIRRLLPEMKEEDDEFSSSSDKLDLSFDKSSQDSFPLPSSDTLAPVDTSFSSPLPAVAPDPFAPPGALEEQVNQDFNRPNF